MDCFASENFAKLLSPSQDRFITPEEVLKLYGQEALDKDQEMRQLLKGHLMDDPLGHDDSENPSCSAADFQGNHLAKEETLIFVSFSMPEASLKKLHEEARVLGGRLVIRGLKENSFTKTAQILKRLGIALDIDPDLFTRHNVTCVPQFIYIKDSSLQRLKGNVSLRYALERFKESKT